MDNQPQPSAPGVEPPAPIVTDQKPSQTNKVWPVVAALLFLLLIAAGLWAFQTNKQLSDTKKDLETAQGELEIAIQALTDSQEKVRDLDSPEKKANDAKRKSDLSRFMAAVNQYATDNNGKYPSTVPSFFAEEFEKVYLAKLPDFIDPNTEKAYDFIPVANVQTPPGVTLGTIQYQWPGKCAGSEFDDDATNRQAAARMVLESGEILCVDS